MTAGRTGPASGSSGLPEPLGGPWIAILQSLAHGVAVLELELRRPGRRLLWCNEAYATGSGRTRRQLMAVPNLDDLQELIGPEGPQSLYRSLGQGRASRGVYRWRGVEPPCWLAFRVIPVDLPGMPDVVVHFERDATEEVRCRQRLRLMACRLLDSAEGVWDEVAARLSSGPKAAADRLDAVLDEMAEHGADRQRFQASLERCRRWAGEVRGGLADLLGESFLPGLRGLSLASALRHMCREYMDASAGGRGFPVRTAVDERRVDELSRRVLLHTAHAVLRHGGAGPTAVRLTQGRTLTSLRIGFDRAEVVEPAALQSRLERQGVAELLDMAAGELSVVSKPSVVQIRAVVPVADQAGLRSSGPRGGRPS